MSKEVIVESFELDHTIVKAPYVRLIGEETGPKGDIISNFDIRLVQPNEDSIPTAGLHTIEHLLAKLIRTRIDGMIDCSPFGCRTGFHMIMWGRHSSAEIAAVLFFFESLCALCARNALPLGYGGIRLGMTL